MHVLSFSKCALALVFSLATFAPSAMANQCGDVSPLLGKLGEQYYNLAHRSKLQLFEQSIAPNNLIHTLQSKNFRSGEGQRTRCFGASTLREEVRDVVLKSIEPARINSFNEIVLNAYEYDSQRKKSHRETLFIPLSEQNISLIGDDGFVVNTRHRQPVLRQLNTDIHNNTSEFDARRKTHLREISITASNGYNGIEIKQLIYVNGHLTEWFTWSLGQ
ncbi:MAG: hypothetical protein AB8B64_01130 [Granulosicoccus sp.]